MEKIEDKKKADKKQPKDQVIIAPEIKDTKDIQEAKESTGVFAFGRFNPPTVGHEKLIQKVHEVAKDHDGEAHVVASHSENTHRDPLPQDKKLEYLKKVAPSSVKVSGSSRDEPSLLHVARRLHNAGHKHLVMVAGSDRVPEYEKLLNKYNGHPEHYNFKSIKVVSAGQRDPDSEGVEGMSGTKMRQLARGGNHKEFKTGLPKALHPHAKEIATHIKGISEELVVEAVLDIAARRKRAMALKRRQPVIQRQRMIALKRFASDLKLKRRARNIARDMVRFRFAGKRGGNYDKLTTSDKIAVDKQVEGRGKLISALAKRLFTRVRKREAERVSRVRAGIKGPMRKRTNIVAHFELSQDTFNTIFEKVVTSQYNLTEKQFDNIYNKAQSSQVPFFELLEQYQSGLSEWKEEKKVTPEQNAFNKINSFIANAKKEIVEDAASHLKAAQLAQSKGQYVKAQLHRKVAGAIMRGDHASAKGFIQQLNTVTEEKAEPQSLDESFVIDRTGLGVTYTSADLGMKTIGGFAHHPSVVKEMEERAKASEDEKFKDMAAKILKDTDGEMDQETMDKLNKLLQFRLSHQQKKVHRIDD